MAFGGLNANGDGLPLGFELSRQPAIRHYLSAFEIKDVGNVTGATLTGWTATVDNGRANAGCTVGGTPGACFTSSPPMLLTSSMVFTIDFTGTNLDFSSPHLKVTFLTNIGDATATGSLLSQNMAPVPEPETYALMLAGLSAMGLVARRRKQAN